MIKWVNTFNLCRTIPGTWINAIWVSESRSVMSDTDPMNCSPPGSSVHGILQARKLKWVALPLSRGESSQPRDWTQVSRITGGFFTSWATREALMIQQFHSSNSLQQLTLVFLPGEFHGQRSLVGYSPWGHKELDMTEWLTVWSSTPRYDPAIPVLGIYCKGM